MSHAERRLLLMLARAVAKPGRHVDHVTRTRIFELIEEIENSRPAEALAAVCK